MSNQLTTVTKRYLTDIANAIRRKLGESAEEQTYLPSQMATAILSIPTGGGGVLYSNYTYTTESKGAYECNIERALLCTLSGRQFYKTTNDMAYVCYAKQTYSNYSGPLLISTIAEGVQYTVGTSPTFSAIGSFIRDGVTWYVSNDEYFMSGDLTSTAGIANKATSLTGSSRILMGESFLDFILALPDVPTTYECYKPTQSGLILPPTNYDGFPALYIE